MPFAERELMLIKIAVNSVARRDVLDIASIFRANAIDVSDHTVTLEVNILLIDMEFCLAIMSFSLSSPFYANIYLWSV